MTVSCFSWLMMFSRFVSISPFSMLCSVFPVQIIWEATATTCAGSCLIHYILFGYEPSRDRSYPALMILLTASYISFSNSFNHFSTFPFATTTVLSFTFSFSGLIIPSIRLLSVVLFPSAMTNLTKASKHFPKCVSIISKLPALDKI